MPTVSVVIPAYNANATLSQTLSALRAAQPPPLEIIVVDDGSTDSTAQAARSFGVRVLSQVRNVGAAAAKNHGAQAAQGDILLFTDSDILLPPDIISRVITSFEQRPTEGIVGLLDENIPAHDWASQFKNLWMHYTYARLDPTQRIGLFYTSIAAMRRATFLELGGFDEKYRGASITEDTEFGQRAWAQGISIFLAASVRVVHLKTYTVSSILREDFKRAYALTLMRFRKRGEPFYTSVPLFYQLAVPTIYLTVLLTLASLVLQNALLDSAALLTLILFYLLNAPLLAYVARARGILFTLKTALILPLDVFIVGLGMARALLNFARGIRY